MKKTISNFQDNSLSRAEMKAMKGGGECRQGVTCQMYRQDPNGTWYMTYGTCTVDGPDFFHLDCFCNIGGGNQKLQSNGGRSRCWS